MPVAIFYRCFIMSPSEQLIAHATSAMTGILADVFTVMMGVVGILVVLVGVRMIYLAITGQGDTAIIPEMPKGMFLSGEEKEYNGILGQEEEKYRISVLRDRARNEVKERHGL
jgi:hypothetical protein